MAKKHSHTVAIRNTSWSRGVQAAAVAVLVLGLAQGASASRPGRAEPSRPKAEAARVERIDAVDVRAAEGRLAELGYWTGPVDGQWDVQSRLALQAFQKVEGRAVTGRLTREELDALAGADAPRPLERGAAHIEVDIARQVLFFVGDDGRVSDAIPVCTGSGKTYTVDGITDVAYTPRGRFTVYRKIDGWRKSRLGLLYYPCYFLSGLAIHGSPSVPPEPESHGCVRVPMAFAKQIAARLDLGTTIIVHEGGRFDNSVAVARPGTK